MRTFEFLFLTFNIFLVHGLECPENGWSKASDICYRIVHFPESFWAAYNWCQTVNAQLLSLANVEQVMAAIGDSMKGNAGDYRIDGYAEGTWYHGDNETLQDEGYELLSALTGKTLTVNLQDKRVSGDTEEKTRLGFICEGGEGLDKTCDGEGKKTLDEEEPWMRFRFDFAVNGSNAVQPLVFAFNMNRTAREGTPAPNILAHSYVPLVEMDFYDDPDDHNMTKPYMYSKLGDKYEQGADVPPSEYFFNGTLKSFNGVYYIQAVLTLGSISKMPTITVAYPQSQDATETETAITAMATDATSDGIIIYACINGNTGDIVDMVEHNGVENQDPMDYCPWGDE